MFEKDQDNRLLRLFDALLNCRRRMVVVGRWKSDKDARSEFYMLEANYSALREQFSREIDRLGVT